MSDQVEWRVRDHLRPHRRRLAAVLVLTIVSSALMLAQPMLLSRLVGTLTDAGAAVLPPAALLVAAALGGALLGAWRTYLLQSTGEEFILGLRKALYRRLLRLRAAEYDERSSGDLLSRLGTDTTVLRSALTSGMFSLVSAGLTIAGAVVLMAYISPVLFGAAMASLLIGAAVVFSMGGAVRRASTQAQTNVGLMTVAMERALSAVRTIRACEGTEREVAELDSAATRARDSGVRIAALQAMASPAIATSAQIGLMLVLVLGGYRVAAGHLELGDLAAFMMYMFMLITPVVQAASGYTQVQAGLAALDRVREILKLPEEAADEPGTGGGPIAPATPAAPLIEFASVTLTYPNGVTALRDVDLAIAAGSRVAIVGLSGSGKSTVLSLIERFYTADSGTVRFRGHDVAELPRSSIRSQIAYVEQDAPLIAGTIARNLRLGRPDAAAERMAAALRGAGLDEFAESGGEVGGRSVGDGGALLSGGQRQRLTWARALLMERPLLVLDEPTASVDARTEGLLQDALDNVPSGTTTIVVAHRLATVMGADRIIVMDQGRVVDSGTHEELLDRNDLYRELASRQMLAADAVRG
ncbi:ABC transporter ATP-binding protein [Streptomonospora litoralis]|uniref:Multidrug export ATP-binding/permease protein n=1 Tax=Streptomonospora litoralis TaxID=2498135 RepID=A0A4P6Q2R2_9ACTN|nr:ABC transporter ATP-binding protein [Streptomonospora litoralis]QBI53074.1 Putative multidrug export ATP-binding/permease protein [Streptomonospora litoralis]